MKFSQCGFVTKLHSAVLVMATALLLTGCAGLNPAQESHAISITYSAATKTAKDTIESGLVSDEVAGCIKAIDRIAYGYVKETNTAAQNWLKAEDSETRGTFALAVNHLAALVRGSLGDLSTTIAKKEC